MSSDAVTALQAVVTAMGGSTREGQERMAVAVDDAAQTGTHLLVQAGTGTGKSLAYLVPAIVHARRSGRPVVVSTATLALQNQLMERDLPLVADAMEGATGRKPTFALVKGRSNYVCVHKLEGGYPDDPEEALFGAPIPTSALGAQVKRVREWAESTDTGDRHHLEPGVSDRAWRSVSVTARECLGGRCPSAGECFVEKARRDAAHADVVVTNHTLLAIDAFEERALLPEHEVVVVDEAHEFADKVTATITESLTAAQVTQAATLCSAYADTDDVAQAGEALALVLGECQPARLSPVPAELITALTAVHSAARKAWSDAKPEAGDAPDAAVVVARAAMSAVVDVCARVVEQRPLDVVWVERDQRDVTSVQVAPLSVAHRMRSTLLSERTLVMTSATLSLGGNFNAVAASVGLGSGDAYPWTALDVGSPFDYQRQGIAYVAAHLPPPTRGGASEQLYEEMRELITAAGGRTLGLFSSKRAAIEAAEEMRTQLGSEWTVLCQDDDQLPTLVRQFAREPATCLFGTLSLWQGVDVPGSSCQLVLIDRIPFPRPDQPLLAARTEAVEAAGGNGFMAVSASHAALLLAQGVGRLIRSATDKGVVACLDSRLATARYAGFLHRSLPEMWPTTRREVVLDALRRLNDAADQQIGAQEPREEQLA